MTQKLRKLSMITLLAIMLCAFVAGAVMSTVVFADEPVTPTQPSTSATAEEGEQAPAATYHIGVAGTDDADNNIFYYETHSEGWTAAVAKAKEVFNNADGNYVKVILDSEWKGYPGSSVGFGSGSAEGDPFYGGQINVPAKTRITIDLNGNTIDRNLGAVDKYNGRALHIFGELTVDDSSDSHDGKITGSNNNSGTSGGGIYVAASGKLVLKNGIITGNKVTGTKVYGAGVLCAGTFDMYGGSITNNGVTNAKENYGGGVCVYGNGKFNMYGGEISENVAVTGGGLCLYTFNASTPTANIKGGTFKNNKAIGTHIENVDAASIGGGAIGVVYNATLSIENCAINNNFAENNGGGIYFYAGRSAKTFTIKDCELKNNVVVSTGYADGGALTARRQNGADAAMNVNIEEGAVIENNKAIHIGTGSGSACGGGISASGCVLNLKGGEISGNSTGKYTEKYTCNGDVSADVKAINDWLDELNLDNYSGFGGGVYVGTAASVDGTLNMSGGVVQNNRASSGGGLYNNGITFNLSGGTVTENSASYGGGMYSSANAVIVLSGAHIMTGNLESGTNKPLNMHLSTGVMVEVVGQPDGANIGFTGFTYPSDTDTRARVFTRGYSENVVKYFTSDRSNYHIFLNEAGQLVFSGWEAQWELDGEKTDSHVMYFTSGEDTFDTSKVTYGGEPVEFFKNGVSVGVGATISVGGVYTATAKVDAEQNVNPVFKIIFNQLELVYEEGEDKNLYADIIGNEFFATGTGTEITPAASVYVKLKNGSIFYPLFELSYENNVNPGTATAIIRVLSTDTNNGITIELPFEILAPVTAAEYKVTWQYNDGNAWRDISETNKPDFTYNGNDFSSRIRAKLSYGDYNTVYVTKESNSNEGLGFTLQMGEMINAQTYTVKVVVAENSGCSLEEGYKDLDVVVKKLDLNNLSADSFTAMDGEMRPLWLLDGSQYLLSAITYNVDGVAVTGTESNYYVRYTNSNKTIALNEAYTVGGYSINRLKELGATVTYNNASATGEENKLTETTTTVTITFTNNFTNVETINVTKKWAIVTINNGFVNNNNGEVYSVSGFKFGDSAEIDAPKPEHGNKVNVTIPAASGSASALMDVEIIYADGSYTINGETDKTFAQYITSLKLNAGTYTMVVTYNGDGVNYFKTEQSYQFVVAQRELERDDLVFNTTSMIFTDTALQPAVTKAAESDATFSVSYINNTNVGAATVIVTGTGNYTGTQLFTFEITAADNAWGLFEVKGWAYGSFDNDCINITSTHGNVNYYVTDKDGRTVGNLALADAGKYTLHATVPSSGNYAGLPMRTAPFEIKKAANGWTVLPSVIEWKFNGYDINTNVILGTPFFGTLTFKIQDAAGKDLTDAFELDSNGLVPNSVKNVLAKLHFGEYKLVAMAEETDNYASITDTVSFNVAIATNTWSTSLGINTWIVGQYDSLEEFPITVGAAFGNVIVKLTAADDLEMVYYEGANGTEELAAVLASLEVGSYNLSVSVVGCDDYNGINDFIVFKVFPPEGLPWWATLAITLGALALAAAIILILWKLKVFEILTDKIALAITQRATIDATIAAVRATKRTQEANEHLRKVEFMERMEAGREAQRNMTPEERAQALTERAEATATKAERMHARASKIREQADKQREQTEQPEEAVEPEATDEQPEEATDNNPTEE